MPHITVVASTTIGIGNLYSSGCSKMLDLKNLLGKRQPFLPFLKKQV